MAGVPFSLEGKQPQPLEEHSRAIDCPVSVLQNLRASVLERFNSTPHGGHEVTGVLFGTRNGDEVRITAFCATEDTADAGGVVREARRAIQTVLSAPPEQGELAGLEAVGWFRAHPRSDLHLGERDLEIGNALFAHLWQLALVMRPGNSAASRVRFYFREREGAWSADCTVREFSVPANDLQPAQELPPPSDEADTALVRTGAPSYMSSLLAPPEPVKKSSLASWGVAVAVLAAAAGGAYYWYTRPQPLALHVSETDSPAQVRIAWDRASRTVANARTGYVEIADGGQNERVELDSSQLHVGYLNHQRRSNAVAVRLVVMADDGTPAEEMARYQAPPGAAAAETPPEQGSGAAEAAAPTPELVVPVPVEESEPVQERHRFQPPVARPAASAPAMQAPAPDVTGPAQTAHNAPASVMTPPVVHTEPPVEKPAPPPVRTAAAPVTSTPNPAPGGNSTAAATRPAAVTRPAAAPTSGRVIWIGRLQKNEPVTITGKTASRGTLIGELPGRPFKFSISPGDLSGEGIVLYTSNLQYANNVVEPPDAHNGWNRTTYTLNPKYANDVSLDEAPAPLNGWNRMVLRSKNPKIAVIVIDWTVVN